MIILLRLVVIKMVISTISKVFCDWLNKSNPQSAEDNAVIQYGLELVLDNLVKLIILQILGILLGNGWETLVILVSFCILRLQAGGVHANSNLGCCLGMMLIWGISLLGYTYIRVQTSILIFLALMDALIIWICAPKSKNIDYFTSASILRRKLSSLFIFFVFVIIAFLNIRLRSLLIIPATLEVITLLPNNNTK